MTNPTRQEFTKRIEKLDVRNLVAQAQLLEVSKGLLDELIGKYTDAGEDDMVLDAERMVANLYEAMFICCKRLKNEFGIEYNSKL